MKRLSRLIVGEQGAVSLYLIMIIVPIFLLCALLIDFSRLEVAEKESENAVKTGVRSTLSAFSPSLHNYGLYALTQKQEQSKQLFLHTVAENMSASVAEDHFQFIDQRLETDGSNITSMYSLGNHSVFKKQILEEMKYRAPVIYSLELADKFKKNGLAAKLGQAAQFSKNAAHIEALIEERDEHLDRAWNQWTDIHQKAQAMHPFYQAQLADLNTLSGKIGIHTVVEITQTLNDAKNDLTELKDQLKRVKGRITDMVRAGKAASAAIERLYDTKDQLNDEIAELNDKISDLDQLLEDLTQYAELLAVLKIKSAKDLDELQAALTLFNEELAPAKDANDRLNAELQTVPQQNGTAPSYTANQSFESIAIYSRNELDDYGSQAASAVAIFSGLKAQLAAVLLFNAENYRIANSANESFWQKTDSLYKQQAAKESARAKNRTAAGTSKAEQRQKAQPYLDQATRAMGGCSIFGSADPFKDQYIALQGDPAKGSSGYYQAYMAFNQQTNLAQPVPQTDFKNADKAGASALSLVAGLESLLTDVRDEFYIDEFAVSKFSYRTLGLEKDASGQIKVSQEMSRPESHALANQELEYMLYGANSCAGNYSAAYAEMFAFRLAVGTAEALTEPHTEALNVGSPLLVLLAAVAEGAVKAQSDMTKLIQGEAVPLSQKLGSALALTYKDYLRVFMLLHSRDTVMLSRLQSLVELNTGISLKESTTYVSGTATSSVKLWFLPGIMKLLGSSGLSPCQVVGNRCRLTNTGVMAY